MSRKDFNIPTRKSQTTENADDIIKQIQADETAEDKKRINLDLPMHLYKLVEERRKKEGYTLKGFITKLIRKEFGVD